VTLFYRSSREVRRETSEIQMQRRVAPRRHEKSRQETGIASRSRGGRGGETGEGSGREWRMGGVARKLLITLANCFRK